MGGCIFSKDFQPERGKLYWRFFCADVCLVSFLRRFSFGDLKSFFLSIMISVLEYRLRDGCGWLPCRSTQAKSQTPVIHLLELGCKFDSNEAVYKNPAMQLDASSESKTGNFGEKKVNFSVSPYQWGHSCGHPCMTLVLHGGTWPPCMTLCHAW